MHSREQAFAAAEEALDSRQRALADVETAFVALSGTGEEAPSSAKLLTLVTELDRRERDLRNRERSLSMRTRVADQRDRGAAQAESDRHEAEARLVAELDAREKRVAELERGLIALQRRLDGG